MTLQTFLNLIAACLGFLAASFFVIGVAHLRAADIKGIASSGWGGFSQNLADSLSTQRAEYLSGAILLIQSFVSQIAANVVDPKLCPSALQPLEHAIRLIVALAVVLLLLAAILRYAVATHTKARVRALVASENKSST